MSEPTHTTPETLNSAIRAWGHAIAATVAADTTIAALRAQPAPEEKPGRDLAIIRLVMAKDLHAVLADEEQAAAVRVEEQVAGLTEGITAILTPKLAAVATVLANRVDGAQAALREAGCAGDGVEVSRRALAILEGRVNPDGSPLDTSMREIGGGS